MVRVKSGVGDLIRLPQRPSRSELLWREAEGYYLVPLFIEVLKDEFHLPLTKVGHIGICLQALYYLGLHCGRSSGRIKITFLNLDQLEDICKPKPRSCLSREHNTAAPVSFGQSYVLLSGHVGEATFACSNASAMSRRLCEPLSN